MFLQIFIQAIFFILVIYLNSYCNANDPKENTVMMMMPMKRPIPNKYSVVQCGPKFSPLLSQSLKESLCMEPIDTIVQLVPDIENVTYNPGSVLVKRCQGHCGKHMSCLPADEGKKLIEVAVQRVVAGKKGHKCIKVFVEEHTRCTCGCKQMASDCNPLQQDYMPNTCMCQCRDQESKRKCERENKFWMEETCSCICPAMQTCTTPKKWVPDLCSCMLVTE